MKIGQRDAQATIEFTIAAVVLFMFLIGSIQLFVWFNKCLVHRHENYEWTRRLAGDPYVMRTQKPVLAGVYNEYGIYQTPLTGTSWDTKNLAKDFVVNKFYIDETELGSDLDHSAYPVSKWVAQYWRDRDLPNERRDNLPPGLWRTFHTYEKFRMFPGRE